MKFGQTYIFSYFNLSKFLIILILCTNVLLAIYETIWLLLLMSACFLVALYHMTVLNCASRPVGSWQLLYNNKVAKLHQKFVSFTQLFSIFFLVKSQHFKKIRQNTVSQKWSLIAHLWICDGFIQFCSEKFSSKSISIFL